MSFANLKKNSVSNFNNLVETIKTQNTKQSYSDSRFWSPVVDNQGNGYAIIRFLPSKGDMPYIKTYTHGFKYNGKWLIEPCPTTINETCPICEVNTSLWNSGIEANKSVARSRKRTTKFISNIYVVSDPKEPTNNGKVFLYSFGAKIHQKIMNAIVPEFEDEKSFDPFNMWTGANFKIKIRQVEGYRNYDKSEFDSNGRLLENDKDLEKVFDKQYSLSEFTNSTMYKSYNDLYNKLRSVIGDDGMCDITTKKPVSLDDDGDDLVLYKTLLED